MSGESNELGGTLPIPTYIVVGVLLTVFGGGAGVNSLLSPRVETAALQQCSNNAQIALDVAAQHGQEILATNERIRVLREFVEERTQNRYTSEDAYRDKTRNREHNEQQDRHLNDHERRLERLEK